MKKTKVNIELINKCKIIVYFIFFISLIIAGFVYCKIRGNNLLIMKYNYIRTYEYYSILENILKRNLGFFVIVGLIVIWRKKIILLIFFSLVCIFFGISIIYLVEVSLFDKLYVALNIFDYFAYFPFFFFFVYISLYLIEKYEKKIKTKSKKFDIITKKYFLFFVICIFINVLYSSIYSYYIYLLLKK